jgi:hypothetical protein
MGVLSKVVKEGVKRGRKSKRGRPKKKVEVKKKPIPKKPKVKRTKAEEKELKKLIREQKADVAGESKKVSTAGGKRDKLGRLLSKHIPPERKELSKAQFRRLVKQGLIGVTSKGKTKNIGKYADIPENIMDLWYGRAKKLTKDELDELAAMGVTARKEGSKVGKKSKDKKKDKFHKKGIPFPIPKGINKTIDALLNPIKAKTGGVVKRKTGGPIGVGKALRGYGKGYK